MALPFIWIGVTLTLKRLRDAQLPLGMVITFFIPLVNIPFLLWLCFEPSRPADSAPTEISPERAKAISSIVSDAGARPWLAFVIVVLLGGALTLAMTLFSANALASYGLGLFVAAPFVQGMLVAVMFGLPRPRSRGACVAAALLAQMIGGAFLLLFALEGAICLIMASPLLLALSAVGGMVGYAIQANVWRRVAPGAFAFALLILLPLLIASERAVMTAPTLRAVTTRVIVAAPAEVVWRHIVSFPPLAEPNEWLFRAGVAYPTHAEINGNGVGAVRHCVFSTGTFVEPIEVWDEPHRLAFSVTEQPPPMVELSPFDVHPPHLDGFLQSHRGEFRLTRLPNGDTQLEGTTWYTIRMQPELYWGAWSDAIIHTIHQRVLDHVRDLAERETPSDDPAARPAQ